jgi:hypothetical protein
MQLTRARGAFFYTWKLEVPSPKYPPYLNWHGQRLGPVAAHGRPNRHRDGGMPRGGAAPIDAHGGWKKGGKLLNQLQNRERKMIFLKNVIRKCELTTHIHRPPDS